jgi:Tol biopolymer transport system component
LPSHTRNTVLFDVAQSDILSVGADGRGLRHLAAGVLPAWSPDGQKIAYVSNGDTPTLWTMNADGSEKKQVSRDEASNNFTAVPSWSPDGKKIAFIRNSDFTYRVWVINADSTGGHPVSPGPDDQTPTWSPDGKKIAYNKICVGPPPCDAVGVVNADGTQRHLLGDGAFPQWSPDGTKIAYNGSSDELWVESADGSHKRKLAALGDPRFAWSPDGKRLAYAALGGGINVIAVDGSGGVPLTKAGDNPTWSPSGATLAYAALEDGAINLVTVRGKHVRKLAEVDFGVVPAVVSWRPVQK